MTRGRHPSGFAARLPVSPSATDLARQPAGADVIANRIETPWVRRTAVRRAPDTIEAAGRRVAEDVRAMVDPALPVRAQPAPERCAACAFLAPCSALERGEDPTLLLIAGYRRRGDEELEDAGLRRSDERRAQQGRNDVVDDHANLRWS